MLDLIEALGIGLVCVTAGSPYYNPHIQRPAYFPPSDGYQPPEDPLVGVARQIAVTAEITARHPGLVVVGSGYSYLQDWLPHVAQAVVGAGGATWSASAAWSCRTPPRRRRPRRPAPRPPLVCRTFSDCTTAPRNGLVSGCFPLDPFYKDHPQRVELAAVKRASLPHEGPVTSGGHVVDGTSTDRVVTTDPSRPLDRPSTDETTPSVEIPRGRPHRRQRAGPAGPTPVRCAAWRAGGCRGSARSTDRSAD